MRLFNLLPVVLAASEMPEWMIPYGNPLKLRTVMFEDGSLESITWSGIEDLISDNRRFIDVTDTGDLVSSLDINEATVNIPDKLSKQRDALALMIQDKISQDKMKSFLTKFSSFHTRYFRSESGAKAVDWLWNHLVEIAEASKMKVTLERIEHEDWPQNSIIARIQMPGQPDVTDDIERVVLSAHLDSTASFMPMLMPAPGADDDGSGTATMVEVFRLLSMHSLELKRPLEFMWYSAEEAGLLGSQAIVMDYMRRQVPAAVLHIDMDGFSGTSEGRSPCMAVVTDNTSSLLTEFIRTLARRYSKLPLVDTACGYACSDHASWTSGGYASAALFESRFEDMNPNIHTGRDTVDKLDFGHMSEFAKVAIAYALHMTDPLN